MITDLFNSTVVDKDMSFCVLDTETTGLDQNTDHLLEVACTRCRLRSGVIKRVDLFHSFVKCDTDIPDYITAMTRIKSSSMDDAPRPSMVMGNLLSFIGNSMVFAHNAEFDALFLTKYDLRFLSIIFVDTVSIARFLLPGLNNISKDRPYRQIRLLELFGMDTKKSHSAKDDAMALTNLVCMFINMLNVKSEKTFSDFIVKRGALAKKMSRKEV